LNFFLKVYFIFQGIGASMGYILAALIHNEQILYFISASIFIICLLSTMTAVKEMPTQIKAKSIQAKNGIENF
jgi:hypothetical protein